MPASASRAQNLALPVGMSCRVRYRALPSEPQCNAFGKASNDAILSGTDLFSEMR